MYVSWILKTTIIENNTKLPLTFGLNTIPLPLPPLSSASSPSLLPSRSVPPSSLPPASSSLLPMPSTPVACPAPELLLSLRTQPLPYFVPPPRFYQPLYYFYKIYGYDVLSILRLGTVRQTRTHGPKPRF